MPPFARATASNHPDEIALRDPANAFTWAEVDTIVNRAVNALLARGLGDGNRVALFAENSAHTALAHLGGLFAGASNVPTNFHLTAPEAAYIFADAGVSVIFAGPDTIDRAVAAADEAGVGTVVAWGCEPTEGVLGWDDWLAGADPADPSSDLVPQPPLIYTSGTTGRPKGTVQPPTLFAGGATMTEHVANLATSRFASFGTHLVVGPMYHTGPLSGARLLAGGIPVVVQGRFDAEAMLASIETYRIETSVMVPTHFVRLLALPDDVRTRYDVSSVKLVSHTGAACPVPVKRAMIDWWGPVFVEAYGASETGTTCQISSEEWLAHPGSVGRAIDPFEALVVDDDNRPVPANTEGRLFFRDTTGRGIVYHNDPEKSAAAHIAPGVFTLGEIGYLDDDGYVFITDRFSDMVVSGGVNIYPAEAEQVLIQHPEVVDVACIGVPHAEMGEELIALVMAADPEAPPVSGELVAWCRDRLTHYKCPRRVEVVADLGRSAMGKVNKRQLRAPYWAQS